MEFLLLIACVLLIMVFVRLGSTRGELATVSAALDGIDKRLGELSRRMGPWGPGAEPATPSGPPPPEHPFAENAVSPEATSADDDPRIRQAAAELPRILAFMERPLDPRAAAAAGPVAAPPPLPPEPQPPVEDIPERFRESPEAPPTAAEAPPDQDAPPVPPPAFATAAGPDFGDLEKRFGTQWVVWVGGIALALGGIFLVRYSIEQGLFGPGLRVIAGAMLALALVGLGELARRREIVAGLDQQQSTAHIPSILTAAGTTTAYADVWAAHALYDFLSPALAFVLLGAVALATLAAALRHGPALAGLGLIGAYVTPALVESAQPNYWALYVYLAVVTAAAYALARIRMWGWLATTASVFSILWMLVGINDPRFGSLPAHAFFAVAGFALAAVFVVPGLFQGPPEERGRTDVLSSAVLAGYLFGAFLLAIASAHATLAVIVLAVLAAASVAAAWRASMVTAAVPVAAAFCALVVVHWAFDDWFVTLQRSGPPWSGLPFELKVEGLRLHVGFAAATAVLFGGAGYAAQRRGEEMPFALLWSAVAVALPVIMLIAVYYRVTQFERSLVFAAVALAMAGAFAYAADTLWRREPREASEAGAFFATGAVACLALTLTIALDRGWLTVALALMVPGIAWIVERRPVPALRKLCLVLVGLVLLRVLWDPRIVGDDVGATPILNWLLWGYGVPALAFWYAGRLLRRQADDLVSRTVEAAAITFTALTAFFEIRHLMNDGDIYRPAVRVGELGLQVSTGLCMIIAMEHVRGGVTSTIHDWAARILALLVAFGLLGLLFTRNPMLTGEPVGGPVFNHVLLGYAFPAVLLGVLGRKVKFSRPAPVYVVTAVAAIVMMLVYLTLEVRTLFQGPVLRGGAMSDAEDYAYSAVWLAFGVALLVLGIALKSQPARLASAAVVILTVAKVFLHDLAGVQGIFRPLSFIGLGLVLMGIGWLYQRLLFPPRQEKEEPAGQPEMP
jgi:uncharacterized membrane protein